MQMSPLTSNASILLLLCLLLILSLGRISLLHHSLLMGLNRLVWLVAFRIF